ncbi:MAG: uracil phosphoribosyltransferase [Bacteroidetes bacterium]|nr:uracil phosphoribosyltransferase [Bacteroidota bacterium]
MIHNLGEENSLVAAFIAEIRDKKVQQDRMRFRRNLERIGEITAYELSKTLEWVDHEVETPLGLAKSVKLKNQPIIGNILRAGLPLHNGLLNFFDQADNAFISAYRKHKEDGSFDIKLDYLSSPALDGRTLILVDPMLATGASIVSVLNELMKEGKPSGIHIVTVIASEQGLKYVEEHYPDCTIWICAVDAELDAKSYIIPGLGDAGDLAFGEKIQD